MIPPRTRTTIAWNCALAVSALTLTSGAASAADLYAGTTQQASPNFSIATGTDPNGRIPVDANWNTTFVQTPSHPVPPATSTITGEADVFHGAAGTSYHLTIGANADLFNVGVADDGDSQFHFTPSINAFLLLMDGASATSRSLIANYGSIGTTYYNPNSAKGGSASSVAYIQNTDFVNYGNIGYGDNTNPGNANYLPTLALQMGPNSSFTNYGTVHSSNGIYEPTASLTPIPNVREDNYGLIDTKGGSGMEGNGIMNNFSTGDLENGTNGSYGIQMYAGTTTAPATASNWGLINFYTNAVYMAQNTTVFNDYGGPLIPGSYVKVPAPAGYKGYSSGCALAFRGALGNCYDTVSPGAMANPGGGAGGSIAITGTNSGSANVVNLHSTVYTLQSSAGGVTPVGTRLLYLPIITGAIWASDLSSKPNSSTVNLYFDGITDGDRTAITNAINSGLSAYEPYDGTVQTVTTDLSVAAVNYNLTNVRYVNLIAASGAAPVPAAYPVGVYHGSPSAPVFYPASLLANPVTLRLTGVGAPALAAGTTYVEAGWVLQLGAMSFEPVASTDGGNTTSRRRNGTENYAGSPGACTAIYIDSGTATANGFKIDGADPA